MTSLIIKGTSPPSQYFETFLYFKTEKKNIRRLGVVTSDVSNSTETELVPVDRCGSGSCLVLGRMNYDGVFKMDSLWFEHG